MKRKIVMSIVVSMLLITGCGENEEMSNRDNSNGGNTGSLFVDIDDGESDSEEYTSFLNNKTSNFSVSNQLDALAAAYNDWYIEDSYGYDTYFYAVTDINQNGYVELIVSSCQGSGIFTYSDIYEVQSDDTVRHITFKEEDSYSQPDIIKDELTGYYNPSDDSYCLYVTDTIRNGAAEHGATNYAMTIDNSEYVHLDIISVFYEAYYDDPNGVQSYYDRYNLEISKAEYDSLEESTFSGCNKLTYHIKWLADKEIKNNVIEMLTDSWNNFSIR